MPRPRSNAIFELAGQWISHEHGTRSFYRFWNDAGTGRTRRESLRTTDFESAKRKLAEIVVKGAPKTRDAHLSVVLEDYFLARTDKLPSAKQSRNAGKVLLRHFGELARISSITEAKQREFAEACLAKGQRLSYAARNLNVLHAALAYAKIHYDLIYTESQMVQRWRLSSPPPLKRFVPTDEQVAALWSKKMPEDLRRWILIQMATGGRPQTAVDLSAAQRIREAKLVDLNPPGRPQIKKKYRPTVRTPSVLAGWLDKWEADATGLEIRQGRYCGYSTIEGVKSALERLGEASGIPQISTYSFRHKVTTVLRLARVSEDEIAVQLGHKRPNLRTTAGYGEWDPSYLSKAVAAIDAWFHRLQKLTERPLFSQGIPKSIRTRKKMAA